ncbi:MAG TPA: HEPN domain-containing protein [Thiotrichaceae bacterium]|nr:HEPN domain-containing protein [Thiotrichaceae bacterium]
MIQATQEELRQEAQRFLRLADRDVKAFQVLKNAPEIHLTTVCFHAQQAIEKCLKAVLIRHGVELHKTHDLEELWAKLDRINIAPPINAEKLGKINPCAVIFRYDDTDIELLSREEAESMMDNIQHWAISEVGNEKEEQKVSDSVNQDDSNE